MQQEAAAGGVLALNGGSSSIKFAVYDLGETSERGLPGHLDRIGRPGTTLTAAGDGQPSTTSPVDAPDQPAAGAFPLDWMEEHAGFSTIRAVGHRVVHGMAHHAPERITPALVAERRQLRAFDPTHLPGELTLIEALQKRHLRLPQFACFDTAFHHAMPRVAQQLPLPRRFEVQGLRRYGFHGLSYAYLMEELGRQAGAGALFCYQARKGVGAFAAVLGGLDTLVFAGGIGEHAAEVRARICAGLEFLGIELDAARNAAHAGVISSVGSRVTVRVIPTDEECMIARTVGRLMV